MPCPTTGVMGPGFPGPTGEERLQEAKGWTAGALHGPFLSQEEKSQAARTDPGTKGHPEPPTARPGYLQHGEIPVLVKDVRDRSAAGDALEEPQRLHAFLHSLVNLEQSALPWYTQILRPTNLGSDLPPSAQPGSFLQCFPPKGLSLNCNRGQSRRKAAALRLPQGYSASIGMVSFWCLLLIQLIW